MSAGARILLVGAGGHARVVIEALQDEPANTIVGAVSDDGSGLPDLGIPMLGTTDELDRIAGEHGVDAVCIAVGNNAARARIAADVGDHGFDLATARSAYAVVSPTATVGAGSHLLPGSVVNAATRLGAGTIVNTNASIDHDGDVGDFVHIAPGVAIGGAVRIGDRTFVGIGARILPGLALGADVIVGGGAVVVSDVPAGTTVVGIPARPVEQR
ncbi:NeuD/PglB/VioB family sugar acetyltransferase [Ilumatobacter nonamiensis]|uniref:NeuD/PglB/VioB family sugar acetyltransferase n=1 Tax=Ilumatobacter nonamiensis TaxID=467093 RepID=UPI000346A870|nr:NeuD/PglB/VioB family sugar acetyltransferase [Ilumatobacter nonamiensis]